MLGRSVEPSEETFAYLASRLSDADIALANLESPLTNAPVQIQSAYMLCALPEHAGWLSKWGLDVLTLANNHIQDCGQAGQVETFTLLREQGLTPVGPGIEPVYLEINGLQIAVFAFDDVSTPLDMDKAMMAVQAAHQTDSQVIVSIHWGMEYQGGASSRQVSIAQQLADAGATVIWGHHPHVLQGTAWLNDGQTLVFYSLGNALFDQYGLDDTRLSALLLVKIDQRGILSAKAVPFEIDVPNSLLVEPEEAEAQAILEHLNLTLP